MKIISLFRISLISLVIATGCSTESNESTDQTLYDQVMEVHDEAMTQMDKIYQLKTQLQKRIANPEELVEEKRKNIERMIINLDSAQRSMMVWMRAFSPLPDSIDQQVANQYLEDEMIKIEDVRKSIQEAIEEASAELD